MPLPPPASTLFPYTTLFRSIASEKGKLLDLIARRYGNTAAREFLDKVTKVGNGFLTLRGFSTSIDDEDLPAEARNEIETRITETKARIDVLLKQYKKGDLQALPG